MDPKVANGEVYRMHKMLTMLYMVVYGRWFKQLLPFATRNGHSFFYEQSFFRMNEIFSEKECRPEKTNDV